MLTPDGARNLHRPAVAFPVALTNASVVVTSTEAALVGLALREMTGAAGATVDVFNGGSANGNLLGSYSCAAGGQIKGELAPAGVWAGGGIFVQVGGQVQGAVHIIQPIPADESA